MERAFMTLTAGKPSRIDNTVLCFGRVAPTGSAEGA
jgi:hypothetical protein